ncbi:hypothetical protein [Nocardia sp. NPDC050413]|uniref:hypothetical protein n=1 Tax=Nocardia sp. NPDC050413 TaxID=3155784 RepID=UPI0033E3C48D
MAAQGWFNHYDDPDEFWDEEPIIRKPTSNGSHVTSAALPNTVGLNQSVPPSDLRATGSFGAESIWSAQDDFSNAASSSHQVGSRFAIMELDRGLLPTSIDLRPGWGRYVAPTEVGDELMLAYRKAVSVEFETAYSGKRRPSPADFSINAVPTVRIMLMVLLETETWQEFSTVSSAVNSGSRHEVHGHVMDYGGQPVVITGDRRYLRSIEVEARWAASVHADRIVDEVLWCVDHLRSERPQFKPRGDYSRYSVEDLKYHVDRHRVRLLDEWVGNNE